MHLKTSCFLCIILTIQALRTTGNPRFPFTGNGVDDRVTTATSTINNAAAMETSSDTAAAKVASTKRKEETQRKYLALEFVWDDFEAIASTIVCSRCTQKKLVGGWTTDFKSLIVKLDHFPKDRGKNKTCLKPPPRHPLVINLCYARLFPGKHSAK